MKKHFLLSGASGYIGKYVLNELLDRNYKVTALTRNPSKLLNLVNHNHL